MKVALIGKNNCERGVSLLEAIIALALFATMITVVVLLYFGGQNFSTQADIAQSAIEITQASLEGVRSIRDVDWDFLVPGTHGLLFTNNRWSLVIDSPDTIDGFTRRVTIANEESSDDIRLVTVDVSWDTAYGGASTSIRFTEQLNRWREIQDEDYVVGDWSSPVATASYGFWGEDIIGRDVAARKTQVYLVTSSDQETDADLFVFDVQSPTDITLTGSLDVSKEGLNSIYVKGGYAYTVDDGNSEFSIIDVLDPTNLTIVSQFIPSGDAAESLYVLGRYAYIGTQNEQVHVIDIIDPTDPKLVETYDAVKEVYAIDGSDDVLYVAIDDERVLETVDISDPLDLVHLGDYFAEDEDEKGRSVYYKSPSRVFVGRDNGGNHEDHGEFMAFDASDPTDIKLLDSVDLTQTTINDLHVASGSYAFLAARDENESDGRFIIIDVSDINNMSVIANVDIDEEVMGIDFYKNYVYLAVNGVEALQVITSGP